jgi:hypothetical protein
MAYHHSPRIITDNLVLALDAANSKLKTSSLRYRWWSTVGGNPTTKAGFDAFFTGSPNEVGIHSTTIDWLTVGVRPTYLPETQFAWEVKGLIKIDISGTYVFNTRSDDGNELQINNEIVTSFYGGRGVPNPGDISASITLATGIYPFQYRMQQGAGGAGAQVRWQIPGSSTYEVIPASNFLVGLGDDVFVDLSRNGNDGILINGPTFDSGNLGSLSFDGVNDSIAIPPSSVINNLTTDFTFQAFVRFNTSGGQYGIFTKGSTFTQGWTVYLRQGPQFSLIGHNTSNVSSGLLAATPSGEISVNIWYHITYTFNGSVIISYINGSQRATSNYSQTFSNVGINPKIGHDANIANPTYWSGNISNVTLYNRALTAEEVLQNYNATKGRFGL